MKLLSIGCFLLLTTCAVGQSAPSNVKPNKAEMPKLSDVHLDVDSDGGFTSPSGTHKQLSTLKVSDLPGPNDLLFSIEAFSKCVMFDAMVVENEKRGGALGRMLPSDVLDAVFAASSSCLF